MSAAPSAASANDHNQPTTLTIAEQLMKARQLGKLYWETSQPAWEAEERSGQNCLPLELKLSISKTELVIPKYEVVPIALYLVEGHDTNSQLITSSWKRYSDFENLRKMLKRNSSKSLYTDVFNKLPTKWPSLLVNTTKPEFVAKRMNELNVLLASFSANRAFRPPIRQLLHDFSYERNGLTAEETLKQGIAERKVLEEKARMYVPPPPTTQPYSQPPTSSAQPGPGGYAQSQPPPSASSYPAQSYPAQAYSAGAPAPVTASPAQAYPVQSYTSGPSAADPTPAVTPYQPSAPTQVVQPTQPQQLGYAVPQQPGYTPLPAQQYPAQPQPAYAPASPQSQPYPSQPQSLSYASPMQPPPQHQQPQPYQQAASMSYTTATPPSAYGVASPSVSSPPPTGPGAPHQEMKFESIEQQRQMSYAIFNRLESTSGWAFANPSLGGRGFYEYWRFNFQTMTANRKMEYVGKVKEPYRITQPEIHLSANIIKIKLEPLPSTTNAMGIKPMKSTQPQGCLLTIDIPPPIESGVTVNGGGNSLLGGSSAPAPRTLKMQFSDGHFFMGLLPQESFNDRHVILSPDVQTLYYTPNQERTYVEGLPPGPLAVPWSKFEMNSPFYNG